MKNFILYCLLILGVCVSHSFAEEDPIKYKKGSFPEVLQKQFEQERKKIESPGNKQSFQEMAARVRQMVPFIEERNKIISDPVQYSKLAKEIGIGGIGEANLSNLSQAILPLVDKHSQMLSTQQFTTGFLTAMVPLSRNAVNSNGCNPGSWPGNYWCGACVLRILGKCFVYGFTPSTHYRMATQITSVSTDNGSAPWSPAITKQISADFQSGQLFSLIPGVGSLSGGLMQNAKQLIDTIDWKKVCVDGMLQQQAMQLVMTKAVAGGGAEYKFDLAQQVQACIQKAQLDYSKITKAKDIDAAKISSEMKDRLKRNLLNQVTAKNANAQSYSYTHTPFWMGRVLTKQFEESATYPNIRIYVTTTGHFWFNWVLDKSFVHHIKPPYEPTLSIMPPINEGNTTPGVGQLAYNAVPNETMNDMGISPYAATPPIVDGSFNPFKHVADLDNMFPMLKPPSSQKWTTSILYNLIDPKFAPLSWQFTQHLKNPNFCDNPMLAEAWKSQNPFGSMGPMRKGLQAAKALSALSKLGFGGSSLQNANLGINKYFEEYLVDQGTVFNLCSTRTKVALGTKPGTAVGPEKMSGISKTLAKEVNLISGVNKELIQVFNPPRNGFRNPLPSIRTTNPYYYDNKYRGSNAGGWYDKVQYISELEKLNPPFALDYSKQCREEDISDEVAKMEKDVYPGAEAKSYLHWTAFNACPAFKPISSFKISGFPLVDEAIGKAVTQAIGSITGGKIGIKPFSERWY